MKAVDIALKDMRQSFRSKGAIVFMFVVPILITVLFSFMFGSIAGGDEDRDEVLIRIERAIPLAVITQQHVVLVAAVDLVASCTTKGNVFVATAEDGIAAADQRIDGSELDKRAAGRRRTVLRG